METAESEVLAMIRKMPQGYVMRNRVGINPCVVLQFVGFMTVRTHAEGATWDEVLTRMQLMKGLVK